MNFVLVMALLFFSFLTSAQNTRLEDFNNTVKNSIEILKMMKKDKPKEIILADTIKTKKILEPITTFTNKNKFKTCNEFCIINQNKIQCKVSVEYKLTEEKQQLLVMSKDKSCFFDIPFGLYTIRIYQEDKLVKKTDVKIEDEEQTMITIPE